MIHGPLSHNETLDLPNCTMAENGSFSNTAYCTPEDDEYSPRTVMVNGSACPNLEIHATKIPLHMDGPFEM